MPKAYVLVNVDAGSDKEVFKAIQNIDGIAESHITLGAADLIVELTAKVPISYTRSSVRR